MQNFRKPTFQNVFVQRNPLIVMLITLFFLILVSFLMFILPLVFLHREGISSRVLNSNLYVLHFPSYMILHDASFLFSAIQTLLSPCEAIRAVPAAHKHYTPPSCFLSCFLHVACFFWYFYQDCLSSFSRENNSHGIWFSLLPKAFLVY